MPRILPSGGDVDWPLSEGTLGVVGVAPWATLEFCRILYGAVNAKKDWHYPRVLLDINTKIPSRGRHLQLGETDPSDAISATIEELAAQGATVAVVVCNTAHILYERWARDAPIPILHIIEETVRFAISKGAERVAPLVSASMAEHDLYGQRARVHNLACSRPGPEDQRIINDVIETIKVSGVLGPDNDHEVRALLRRMKVGGVDTIIAGCTELSLLAGPCAAVGLRLVDSNAALALAALDRLQVPSARIRANDDR